MIPTRSPRSIDDNIFMPISCPNKEYQAATARDLGDDLGGTAEVRECRIKGDDVDAVADTEDVGAVTGVPKRGGVAEVGLSG